MKFLEIYSIAISSFSALIRLSFVGKGTAIKTARGDLNVMNRFSKSMAFGFLLGSSVAWGQTYTPRQYDVKLNFDSDIRNEVQRFDVLIEQLLREALEGQSGSLASEREKIRYIEDYKAMAAIAIEDYFLWVDNFSPEITPVEESLLQAIYQSREIPISNRQTTFAEGPLTRVSGYKDFASYLYNVAAAPIDARSWKKLQMMKLVNFHVANGLSPFYISMDLIPRFNRGNIAIKIARSAELNRVAPIAAEYGRRVPNLKFDERTKLNFFSEELRKRSGLKDPSSRLGSFTRSGSQQNVSLTIKNSSFDNLVSYNDLAVTGFKFDFGTSAPDVIQYATCVGQCVAIDKSAFGTVIGSFSYAWQLLYLDDAVPDTSFFDLYNGGITNQFQNIGWSLWATMIAFPPTEGRLTVRSTQSFRDLMLDIDEPYKFEF